VHPGGPFWEHKDLGVWSIPKGEFRSEEDPLEAARREFEEETGYRADGNFVPLKPVVLKSGKKIFAWALEFDLDPAGIRSNTFEMEFPPHSGVKRTFPEVDRGAWFKVGEAINKVNPGQIPLIRELERKHDGNDLPVS